MEKFFMKRSEEKIYFVKDWLKLAKENLLFAIAGMKEDFSPYQTICFLCQSSAEKYLKAYLILSGWDLKKIHNMNNLLAFCFDYDRSFENLKEECIILNQYVVTSRYPSDFTSENIGKNEAKEAIDATSKIEQFVLNKLNF